MHKEPKILTKYDYRVPETLIAQTPATPRDAARLMVYDRTNGVVRFDVFRNLTTYLPARSVIVLNRTKVIPARLWCRKETGGRVQVFYIRHDSRHIFAMCDRQLAEGSVVSVSPKLRFTVQGREGALYVLRPSFAMSRLMAVLGRYGSTPIPPYIKHSPLSERALRSGYQTVFARTRGSVAAPTASLHFTPRLLAALRKAGHDIRFVTLHVGLGTFAPLTDEQLKSGRLHEERYALDAMTAATLRRARRTKRPIVAVGTTVARTLESWAMTGKRTGSTDIFIREGYRWKFVDALITNFHVPKSSLMMLVASLVGRTKLLSLYRSAIARRMRFFSFGDGMLIR